MLRLVKPLPRPNSPLKLKFLDPSLYPDLHFALMGSAVVHSSFSHHPVSGWFCKERQQTNRPKWMFSPGFTGNSCFVRADSLTLQTYSIFNMSVAAIFTYFHHLLAVNFWLADKWHSWFHQQASASVSVIQFWQIIYVLLDKNTKVWWKMR